MRPTDRITYKQLMNKISMRNYMITITRVLLTGAAIFLTANGLSSANARSLGGVVQTGGTDSSQPLPNVTVTLFEATNGRPTALGEVHINSESEINDVKIKTKGFSDVYVVKNTIVPGGHTGWHSHPGVVLVVVESGHVTTHDANCQTKTYGPGQAFVESGTDPFMVSNESSTEDAVDIATIASPAGSPFRVEADPPPCA